MTDIVVINPGVPAELRAKITRATDYSCQQHAGATIEAYEKRLADICRLVRRARAQAATGNAAVDRHPPGQRGPARHETLDGKPTASGNSVHPCCRKPRPADNGGPKGGAGRDPPGPWRTAPDKEAAATDDLVRRMADACGLDLTGKRNRAILLLGFDTALRRAELAALEACDMVAHPKVSW
jgi:integrase